MSDTTRTILPTLIQDDVSPSPPSPYEVALQKVSRVRQFVVEMDLINCQNSYSQRLRQWLKRTQEFGHALWMKSGVSVDDNAAIAPDGSSTADVLHFSVDDSSISQVGQS